MLNFNFYNPTRIIFGGDTIAKINDYVPTEAKVLMLLVVKVHVRMVL